MLPETDMRPSSDSFFDKKADVHSEDRYGRTPLWWAAVNRHDAVILLLRNAMDNVD